MFTTSEEIKNAIENEKVPKTLLTDNYPMYEVTRIATGGGNINFKREEFDLIRSVGMYVPVTKSFCTEIVDWADGRKIFDLTAGRGWLVRGLLEAGARVDGNVYWDEYHPNTERFEPFIDINMKKMPLIDAIDMYSNDYDIFIISSIFATKEVVRKAIKHLQKINPDVTIIYIGDLDVDYKPSRKLVKKLKVIKDESFRFVQRSFDVPLTTVYEIVIVKYKSLLK